MPNTPLQNQYGQTFWTAEDFARLTSPQVASILLGAQFSNTAPTFSFVTDASVGRPGYVQFNDFTPLDNPLFGGAAPDPDGNPDLPPVPGAPPPVVPPYEKAAFVAAFNFWNDVTRLTLTQTSDTDTNVGNIRVGKSAIPVVFGPDEYGPEASDIWLPQNFHPNGNTPLTDAQNLTVMRDVGLALGLKNPFVASAFNDETLGAQYNSQGWTMYSNNAPAAGTMKTPGYLDVAAMQTQFGVDASHTGADNYVTTPGSRLIYDTGGLDSLTLSAPGTLNLGGVDVGGANLRATTTVGSFTIFGPGTIIENGVGSQGNDTINGSNGDNRLQGRGGNDAINGNGGNDQIFGQLGVDTISTGDGRDTVVFNVNPIFGNRDFITDFRPVSDSLQVENAIFTALAPALSGGRMNPINFYFDSVGAPAAHDLNDRFIQGVGGGLFYDSDGTGPTAQVQVAQFTNNARLTAADFFVI